MTPFVSPQQLDPVGCGEPAAPASSEKTEPAILTTEERMSAENLALRATVLTLRRQEFINEANAKIANFDRELMTVGKGIHNLQKELTEKYGIDFTKYQIEPDTGRIIPA
jgi:hypothetical protein